MQENEFEKRVREEMAGLRLRPSEEVWDKVEAQLQRRKKRRVVFAVFLLAGLSLAGLSGYFIFNNQTNVLTDQVQPSANQQNTAKGERDIKSSYDKTGSHQPTAKKEPNREFQDQRKTREAAGDHGVAGVEDENKVATDQKRVRRLSTLPDKELLVERRVARKSGVAESLQSSRSTKIAQSKEEEKTVAVPEFDVNKNNNDTGAPVISGKESETTATDEVTQQKQQQDTDVKSEQDSLATVLKGDINTEATPKTTTSVKPRPFKWGLDLALGVSRSGEEVFTFGQKSMSADNMYNSPVNNPAPGMNSVVGPSDVKQGKAFRVGVVAEKNISRKASITAGLSYAYYDNTIRAGAYRDTNFVLRNMALQSVALNAYYQGPQRRNYTNRYHFLQVPLSYQLQLNKGLKTPILWSIGTSLGYLVNTNALVYDTAAGGIYYKDKNAFSKMHLNITTGFAFRFGNKQVQWSIGPEVAMDTRRLMKDATLPKQYFLYGGINGRVLFNKKNK